MKIIASILLLALTAVTVISQYTPIQCFSETECDCRGSGVVQCGNCPDDGGSKFKLLNVCYCELGGGGPRGTGFECNPERIEGPVSPLGSPTPAPTLAPSGYKPIVCGSKKQCGCTGSGTVQCGKCPDDGMSKFKEFSVCYCGLADGGPRGTGYECDPVKLEGPKRSNACRRRRRRLL